MLQHTCEGQGTDYLWEWVPYSTRWVTLINIRLSHSTSICWATVDPACSNTFLFSWVTGNCSTSFFASLTLNSGYSCTGWGLLYWVRVLSTLAIRHLPWFNESTDLRNNVTASRWYVWAALLATGTGERIFTTCLWSTNHVVCSRSFTLTLQQTSYNLHTEQLQQASHRLSTA